MYWKVLLMPLVGAVIGYVTNWIAVKMLFRPREEVRIFGRKLPFTPGVIPKGQGRLARAVGRAVEEQLLTKEVLKEVLLSEPKKEALRSAAARWMEEWGASEHTIKEEAIRLLEEEPVEDFIETAEEEITDVIYKKIIEINPGNLVAEKALESVREKLADSMFGMMLGDSFLVPLANQVGDKINEYVEENGRGLVEQIVMEESEKLQRVTVGEAVRSVDRYEMDLPEKILQSYEKLVEEKLPILLETLSLSSVVEKRINAMDVMEVEDLMLSIMKKELGAIVNLGALIGLILGLANAAILLI